ncbi:MAG: SDR family NAD(P)-dependent oxidoreductase [Sphingomonadaceae bacterium]
MDGRIALVTGANKGIGFATAEALLKRGMTVYVGSRDAERGRVAVDALGAHGSAHLALIDMADEGSMAVALAAIEAAHGRLDVLVNNAGVALDGASAVDADPAIVRRTMDTNVHAPARLIQLAVPLLRKSAGARVVNVSSGVGSLAFIADPAMPSMGKIYAYSLSKLALNGVTTLFADALRGDGIKVNSANPGVVKTDLSHQMGRRLPAEGAEIIVRLATLDEDGPTGGFFDKDGPIAW